MNPDNLGQNNSSTEWIPLSEAAQFTPYSADYLSLLARKRRLTAKKIDGIWYTTKGIINNYLTQQAKRAEALNQNTDSYLPFISDSAKDVPEAPESNVQYSRTYADDFQKIRPATSEQVVAEETKSVTGSESSSVKLPPVLVPLNEIRSVNVATVSVKENLSREENKLTPAVGVAAPNYSSNEVSKTEVQVAASVDPLASKSVSGDALMEEFMRRFNAQIDRQVDSQHGFLFKISRFIRRSYGYTLRSPKRLPLFIACLFLVVILPFRFVSGFADTFFTETMHAVKNAQTVMGFRPGTHENEILLLGPEGEIAIYGNVETEGQFRSYVEDGIAPITVKSTTKVDNLNADMLDGVSGHEFTLAYVTKNGNVTHEPVFLEGTVEVGQTLLVKGATKLLNSLQVDGNLSVFGEANFARGISVSGPAVFKNILTAPSVIVSDLLRAHKLIVEDESIFEGLVTIKDDLDVEGSITASSGRINGSFRVEEGFHAMQNVSLGSDAYTVRITSAEWSVDNDGNAVFADIIGEEASFSSLSVGGNASASTFTATNPNSTSTFQGALSVGTTTSYEMLTLDGALYLASIAAPSATSSRLHNQDGTLYWAGSAFAGPTLGTWSTDGTNVWRTTGNVGIGTSSPNAQLHVDGGDVLFNSAGGGPGFYFDESNGRLGLGTTTPAQTLTVVGSARITGSLFDSAASAGTSGMILSSTGSGTSWIATSTLASNYFQQDGNSFGTTATLGTNDTNDLAFETDNSTRMTIDTNGNVGIGTTSPNQKFQVSGGGIKLDNNQNLIWRNSANTGDTSVLALSGDTTILRGGGGAPTMQLQTTGGSAIMSLLENGNVGIGTTTPTQLFSVAGNTYITGGLGIGIATTSSGVLETAGNARIGGDLAVVGTTTTDKLAVNSYVISDLIPEVNAFYNLGSSARYWNDAYIDTLTVNNISAASTSISGTQSESFTINSDNATADTENMDLVFYRGTVVPNALISWDAVRDRFDINQPFFIQNDSSTTTVVTLDVYGTAGQTADIFRVASSTGTSFLNVTTGGNVGIGETAPGSKLSVSGGGSFGASYDTTAAPTNGLIIEGNVGIGTTTPTTQLQLYRTSNAFPATSGSTQSAGQQLRLGGGAQAVLDFGSNGTSGAWIQSTLGTNLATNYPLLLNPNGGNVGIGTTSPSQMLSVGATTGSQFLVTSAGAVTDGSWTADVIADDYGGTGQSTYATGDMLYASGANTLAKRTIGSTGNILSVVGGVPTWSATSTLGFTTASDFDTCAEFAAIMTGETGTCGSVVLSVGPTFTGNTTLANASSTNLTNSGASYFGGLMSMTGSAANIALGSNYLSGDGGDEGVFVDSSGSVGIGTANPLEKFQIGSAFAFHDGGHKVLAFNAYYSGTFRYLTSESAFGIEHDTTSDLLEFTYASSGTADATSTLSTALAINTSGNVGIGTTTPVAKLSVFSNDNAGATPYSGQLALEGGANNIGINIVNTASGGRNWGIYNSSGAATAAPSSLRFFDYTAGADRMVINSSGNVGIGTSTPAARLNVLSTTEQLRLSYNSTTYWTDTIASDGGRTLTGFGSDGDLDIIFTGATDGDFSINGDDLFVDTSAGGFVGIGDATPAALLTVGDGDLFRVDTSGRLQLPAGATGAGNLALSTTGDTNTGLYFSAADTLTVQAGGTDILDVTTDGIDITGVNNNIVGDSTDASGTTVLLSVTGAQSVAHTGTHMGIDSNPTYTAASGNTLVAMNGMRTLPQNSSSGTITTLRGLIAQPQNISTGSVTSMMGVYALPINTSTGTTTTMYGMISQPRASNGTVTSMYGMYSDCGASGASASVTTCYGLFVAAPTLTGTMGNAYAIWVADNDIVLDNDGTGVAGGTTGSTLFIGEGQDLELYHDGTNSYIMNNTGDLYIGDAGTDDVILSNNGGNVGIGTTTPDRRLSVVGASGTSVAKFDLVGATADTVLELSSDDGVIGSGSNFLSWSDGGTTLGVIRGDGNVGIGDTTPAALLTVGNGDLFQVNSSGAIAAVTGITTSGDIDIGSGAIIDFAEAAADKIHLYSNTYGIGIESSTLTNWSGSQFRWRTGGTSASTGTERMLLTTTGLDVTGTIDSSGAMTEAGSAVLSAANIDTCSELAALTGTTGGCGSFVLSASPTLTGTTQTATINMSSGELYQTQSASYNVYIQGSAPGTAAGDTRNIALIGNAGNDDLILNYNSEYDCVSVGGTSCTDALTVTGAISATTDISASGTYYNGDSKAIVQYSDSWLRLNPLGDFTSGIYAGTGIFRTDGTLQVGASGATLSVVSGGDFNFDAGTLFGDNSAGRVGIANTAPSAQLHITFSGATPMTMGGNTLLAVQNNTIAGTDAEISIISADESTLNFGDAADENTGKILYDNDDNSMNFYTNTTQEMIITSGGNIGFGTTDFTTSLGWAPKVKIDGAAPGIILEETDTNSMFELVASGGTFSFREALGDGTSPVTGFTVNGSVFTAAGTLVVTTNTAVGADPLCWDGAGASTYGDCSSLGKWKTNIEDYDAGLEEILAIEAVTFDWKRNEDGTLTENENAAVLDPDTGFIAEQVASVSYNFGRYDKETGALRDVNERGIMGAMVNAIKETHLSLEELLMTGSSTQTENLAALSDPESGSVWSRMVALAESFVDGVLELASAEIQYVKADKIETKELCVGSVCVDEGTFLQMVEKSGGAVHAMEHESEPEPEPEENTATSTDDGVEGGGGTTEEETPTDEEPAGEETGETGVDTEETTPTEEEPEAETPADDTEEVVVEESVDETPPETAG